MSGLPQKNKAPIVRIIHAALVGGPLIMMGTLGYLRTSGKGTMPEQPAVVGFALAGAGAMAIAIASALLRPRIVPRASGETTDEYWTAANYTSAVILWAVLEVAALGNVVGFYTTGQWSSVAVFFLAIIMSILFRPGVLERN